jgi:anti-anti-sigma regulatory factor
MYEFRDEAIEALTPRSSRFEAPACNPDDWNFEQLEVTLTDNVTSVVFKEPQYTDSQTENALRNDFLSLAEKLGNNSKVLLDFTGIDAFSGTAIQAIVAFNAKLQNKGSRIALCCLEPTVRAAFFPAAKT